MDNRRDDLFSRMMQQRHSYTLAEAIEEAREMQTPEPELALSEADKDFLIDCGIAL